MQNIFKKLISLFGCKVEKPVDTAVEAKTNTTAKFPEAKGYIIHTREGGTLNCLSQKNTADTLAALYGIPITRDHVHYALKRYEGRLAYRGEYIATIHYRKEN